MVIRHVMPVPIAAGADGVMLVELVVNVPALNL